MAPQTKDPKPNKHCSSSSLIRQVTIVHLLCAGHILGTEQTQVILEVSVPMELPLEGEKPSKQVLLSQLKLKTRHKMNGAQRRALMGSGGFIRQETVRKGLLAQAASQLKLREAGRQAALSLDNLQGRGCHSAHLAKGAGAEGTGRSSPHSRAASKVFPFSVLFLSPAQAQHTRIGDCFL